LKKEALLLATLMFIPALGWAEWGGKGEGKEPVVTWEVSADFISRYVWRGYAYSSHPVVQPDAQVGAYGFWLELWSNIDLTDESHRGHTGRFNEFDPSINYNHSWGPFSIEPSVEFYFFPNQVDSPFTGEFDIILSYELGPVTLKSSHNFDIIRNRGSYFGDFGVSWEHEFSPKVSMETSSLLGWASGKFNETYGASSETTLNVFQWGLAVVYKPIEHLYLRPHMEVSALVDGGIRRAMAGVQDLEIVTGGMAIGANF
jgi:hypothetical protein